MTPDPRTLYTQRLEERRAAIAHAGAASPPAGHGKLAMAACGGGAGLAGPGAERLLDSLGAAAHRRLRGAGGGPRAACCKALERRRRAARFFEKALARLDGNWAGTGETGEALSRPRASRTRRIWTCSARARCSNCFAPRGRTLAKIRWRDGCWRRPSRKRCARASRRWTNCGRGWICARTWRWWRRRRAPAWIRSSLAAWGEAPPAAGGPRIRAAVVRCTRRLGVLRRRLAAFTCCSADTAGAFTLAAPVTCCCGISSWWRWWSNGWFLYRRQRRSRGAWWRRWRTRPHELGLLSEVLVRLEREQFTLPLLAALRASLDAGRRAALAPHGAAETAGGVPGFARQRLCARAGAVHFCGRRTWRCGWRIGGGSSGHGGAALAGGDGRDRSAVLAGQPRLRASGRSVPGIRGRGPLARGARASAIRCIAEDRVVRNDVRLGGAAARCWW